jgi:hypothetical protein
VQVSMQPVAQGSSRPLPPTGREARGQGPDERVQGWR